MGHALIECINRITHVLGLRTVAEWVETDAILETMRALGVDSAQGHAVGIPMALSDLATSISEPEVPRAS